jgi:hypothetical protein
MARYVLPVPDSRSDDTRKAVLHAISKGRGLKLVGRKGSASAILRVGEYEASLPKSPYRPFSRASLYKYGGPAFRKVPRGQRTDRRLRGSDSIPRRIDVFSNQRWVEIGSIVRSSSDASKAGRHAHAMRSLLVSGNPNKLLGLSEADRTLSDGRVLVGDPEDVQRAADEGRLDDFREAAGS